MNHREAMRLALEALQYPLETSSGAFDADKAELMSHRAVTALRAALAEPEQEPVRLRCTTCGTVYADGVPPQVPEQKGWFTVEELNEFATKLKEKAWKA